MPHCIAGVDLASSSSPAAAPAVAAAWRTAVAEEMQLPERRPAELVGELRALSEAAAAAGPDGEECLSDLLLSGTWILSLRAAAATKLHTFGAARLAALVSALGRLPLHAEASPLPIGFGTPRWALPRAVADTGTWESFLCATTDAFLEDLDRLLQEESGGGSSGPGRGGAAAGAPPEAQAALAAFACGLAASNKWTMARVDAGWVVSEECERRVAAFVALHWPRLVSQLERIDADSAAPPGEAAGAGAAGQRRRRLRRSALSTLLARAQLQQRMSPPAALLERFFDESPPPALWRAVAGGGGDVIADVSGDADDSYSLEDLEQIVRTLMQIGCSPSERWLHGLVGVVTARRPEMGQQQLRGFVEALRFFRTQRGTSKQLRNGISLLSEWL
ncbi:hypothetical protein MNEG_2826 [Monoraphidium neglectum]|uniref:Uncharacterized protein n=1 Tax=Monoraphidium neglectum TaxID=145388 RepID=A0A0D2MXP7_9CHLO|nr:hypothetical protein MNEG_2826 [Monoraphidium neglectum]KIZ05132.1 hypothetical protein MNEG_2826 [Monoraphidium neglectum]|eukprot:XP_013904151.1 hypothetical protein MNEG_2826 [Monoraphidium neglectum]